MMPPPILNIICCGPSLQVISSYPLATMRMDLPFPDWFEEKIHGNPP